MNKRVIEGYVYHEPGSENQAYTGFSLPATFYELEDTLERARLDDDARKTVEITGCEGFPFLSAYLDGFSDLNELNALAGKLAAFEPWQVDAFEGLLLMEAEKCEPIEFSRIYDLAASVDQCQVLYAAKNDEELGEFYVENDFIPELENVPDKVLELLDYAKIGEMMRTGEGGVFLRYGSAYVFQTGDLVEEFKTLDFKPQKPDYIALLEVSIPDRGEAVMLKLPCERDSLENVMNRLEARGWYDLVWRCPDCRIPALADAFSMTDNINYANLAARQLGGLSEKDVRTLKALIEVKPTSDLTDAMTLLEHIDEYLLSSQYQTPEALGKDEIRFLVSGEDADVLLPHVNLRSYGKDLIEHHGLALTSYGIVERRDSQPLFTAQERQQHEQSDMGGMEME